MVINLDALDRVKMLAAIYILSGHMIMLASGASNNHRELSGINRLAVNVTNGTRLYR